MWKLLQSLPRGVRHSIACYARQNGCVDESKDSAVATAAKQRRTSLNALPIREISTWKKDEQSYNRKKHEDNFRFRRNDDCWNYMSRKCGHTLLEALGWGAAITAGILATRRPNLLSLPSNRNGGVEKEKSLVFEYAAAMPLGDSSVRYINDTKAICDKNDVSQPVRTRVNRADSGFHESQNDGEKCESTVSPSPEPLWDSKSSTVSQYVNDTDCSWDSSSGSSFSNKEPTHDVTVRDFDLSKKPKKTKVNNETQDSFAEAYEHFEELMRHAYGRQCNHKAIRALKNDQDYLAVHHWMKSSTMGYDKGQYNLARCYEDGIGTYRDLDKAKYYYGLAASQGHPEAAKRLNKLETTRSALKIFQQWTSAQQYVKCHQETRVLPDT